MTHPDRLYRLLPSHIRLRDAGVGEPLRALMSVLQRELEVLEADVDRLYEDAFIETCSEWVVPYLAELLGVEGLVDPTRVPVSQRGLVANTVAHRRRKGVASTIERVAWDATGWRALAVEMRSRTLVAPHVRSLRPQLTFDPRDREMHSRLETPFDRAARTPELRTQRHGLACAGPLDLALFLWRQPVYTLQGVRATWMDEAGCFSIDPLEVERPLFNRPQTAGDAAGRIARDHLPTALPPAWVMEDLSSAGAAAQCRYYGAQRAFSLEIDGAPVPPEQIEVVELEQGSSARVQAGKRVAVDVCRGRLALAPGDAASDVRVTWTWASPGDVGGGPYPRAVPTVAGEGAWRFDVYADRATVIGPTNTAPTALELDGTTAASPLQQALDAWQRGGRPDATFVLHDSGLHREDLRLEPLPGRQLVLTAAAGAWPAIAGGVTIAGQHAETRVVLDGLRVRGMVEVRGSLSLSLAHCTLLPEHRDAAHGARWALAATGDGELWLEAERCVLGPLSLPAEVVGLVMSDTIVFDPGAPGLASEGVVLRGAAGDAAAWGPPVSLNRCTLLGSVRVREVRDASGILFGGPLEVERLETGGLRYCYVPPGSATPRRFRCQPDLASEGLEGQAARDAEWRLTPRFTSQRYGAPGFAGLARTCAAELRTGAEDGAEIGALHDLHNPAREASLRAQIEEYLPAGVRAALVFVT